MTKQLVSSRLQRVYLLVVSDVAKRSRVASGTPQTRLRAALQTHALFGRKRLILGLALLTLLLAATVSAAPATQTTSAWSGSYFSNPNLQGDPAFTRSDAAIDFTWGGGSPGGGVPSSNFSARWTRWLLIDTPGTWTFTTIADNGVRLFVDDDLVIDAWNDHQGDLGQPTTAHTIALNLTQSFHLVRMEYSHRAGNAEAHLLISSASFPDWRGEYYNNPDLVGAPVFVRNDSAINFDFGTAGPGGGIPGTNFSVRWTSSPDFDAGAYRFTTKTDDGVRLWIDNQLLIDQWHDQTPTSYFADVQLSAGYHFVKMEYYQHGSGAQAVLNFTPADSAAWRGEYFANPGLQGLAALTRNDASINFDWGSAPPGAGIPQGVNWSARWSARQNTVNAGYYSVAATADDGVRVYLDNASVIDQWHDASPTTYAAMVYLPAGAHDWRVEFYQHLGTASLHFQIAPGAAAPSLALPGLAPAEIVIDPQNPSLIKGGDGWQGAPNGNGGTAFSAPNRAVDSPSSNWARWYAPLPRAGYYEVAVYLPAGIGTTRGARYEIAHAGASDFRTLNQSVYGKQWVRLGVLYLGATGDEYVAVSDVTYEPAQSTVVVVDAVRFAAR